MKLQRSPNRWSCLPTAFAMVLGEPVDHVIKWLGHDGSQICWPELPEPNCRIGFHIQELIDYCMYNNYTVTPLQMMPFSKGGIDCTPVRPNTRYDWNDRCRLMIGTIGVITGEAPNGQSHAVAWNGKTILDPNGTEYNLDGFIIETYWMIK